MTTTELPQPTPAAIRAALAAAGHTQVQAAEAMMYGARERVTELLAGRRQIEPVRWAWYLLVTGQHPSLVACPRRRA